MPGPTRNTGYLQNIVQYDASNNITLPANLTVTSNVAINNTTPHDTTQFSLDINGGLIVKNTGKTAQFVIINSNPATGGNHAFVQHTVGGTSGSSYADIQGYYGLAVTGSTVIRLNPLGGNVLIGSLVGTGTRVVVASSTGVLSTQAAQTIGDLNGVPTSRTITINGTTQDLSADRTFTINSMVYPGAGIAVSTGSAWGTSLTDNSSNWNTAYGWGNHAGLYSLLNHTHTFASLTSKPTTLVGYGITDAATSAQGTSADTAYGWGNHASGGYVTLATAQTISGNKTFSGSNSLFTGSATFNSALQATIGIIFPTSGTVSNGAGVVGLGAYTGGLRTAFNGGYTSDLAFQMGANYVYTFPAASGTIALTSDLSTYATQTYVGTQIANLVASSPAALDTLNELAAALGNDAAFSTTVSTALGNRLRVDTASQGLSATLQGYGRTNLGLGTAAVSNTGDFAAASHTHSIANVTGLQTALDGKQASGSYAAATHTHIISDVTGLQTALDGKQASLGFTPYNSTNPSGYISSYTEIDTLQSVILRNAATNTGFTIENGNSTYSTPASTNVPNIYIHNTSTNANGHAILSLRSMGPSGGDPFLSLDIDGVIGWHVGVDNSDDDTFKIGKSWATVGSNTYLSITTSGNTTFGGTISATNFSGTHSGTSSGTNTGDQSLSGLGGAPNNATLTDANTLTTGGFFTGYNATNVPSGISSLDMGVCNIPIWGGNNASERYTMQLFANLDTNSDFYIRKFKYYGAVNLSTWFKLLHSGNYSSYALPLSGGIISGNVQFQSTQPLTFTGASQSGTYNQTAIYFNQNSTSGADANGIFIERGRLSDAGSAEVRHFVIGARGGQIQWKLDGVGTSTQTGSVIASGLDISDNALLNKVKYTQGSYRVYRNLARFDNYNNGIGAIAINTNIPWTAANMLTIQVKGYRYGGDLFDITFGVYAGEGNFYSPCYASNSANRIFPSYTWYKDANNKVVLVLGSTAGSYGVQIWAAEYKQGFGGQDATYANGWSITKITSTTGLTNGVGIPDKTWSGGVFSGDTITNSGISTLSGAVRIDNGTSGTSPKLTFGQENETYAGFKGIYLESFWMYIQIHYNEGLRIKGVNGAGASQTCATFAGSSGNFTALGDVIAYSDARLKKDINTIDSALDKVLSLRGVSYYRTDVETDKKKIGLIAQEVAEILPEVVTENEDGMYSVAYGNIVGLLIEAVKEQQTQIESQKSEIDELKDLVQQLINR